jgi:hypothetical protein
VRLGQFTLAFLLQEREEREERETVGLRGVVVKYRPIVTECGYIPAL